MITNEREEGETKEDPLPQNSNCVDVHKGKSAKQTERNDETTKIKKEINDIQVVIFLLQ